MKPLSSDSTIAKEEAPVDYQKEPPSTPAHTTNRYGYFHSTPNKAQTTGADGFEAPTQKAAVTTASIGVCDTDLPDLPSPA